MEEHALSSAQKRIWYSQKKYGSIPLYNVGGIARMSGSIDLEILEKAIRITCMENEALRFQFHESSRGVFQYKIDHVPTFEFYDFSKDAEPEKSFELWVKESAKQPFVMENSRLYYFALYKTSDMDMGYMVKIHHIIADGWSFQLITDQIKENYELLAEGLKEGYQERPGYMEYIKDEGAYKKTSWYEKAEEYWNNQIKDVNDISSVSRERTEGERISFIMDSQLQEQVEQYCKRYHVSLNTFFTFLYFLYQYKTTDVKELVLGIPLLGRINKRHREIVGTFTNTMPFQYKINTEKTLTDMLHEISIGLKGCIRYQLYPYDQLVKKLSQNGRMTGRLFHTCINYYNTALNTSIAGVPACNNEFYNGYQEFALQIIIRQWHDGKIQLDFDYQKAVYQKASIERTYACMIKLMQNLIVDTENSIKDILLINKEELLRITKNSKGPKMVLPKQTIAELFLEQVSQHPDFTAICDGIRKVTYRELNQLSDSTVEYLIERGIQSGDIVAVIPHYTIESVVVIIAVLKCGGVYLPISEDTPVKRAEEILMASGATYLLAEEDHKYKMATCITFAELFSLRKQQNQSINKSVDSGNIYMIYTSGTTGTPKGVMISHNNLLNYLWWAKQAYIKREQEVFALFSSFAFDFTMTSIYLPLITGGMIKLYKGRKEKNVFENILRDGATTILKITPSHIPLLLDVEKRRSDKNLHAFIIGGENLNENMCKKLNERFDGRVDIFNEYGPTEATIGCMTYRYQTTDSGSVPIGKPIANTSIYLLDQNYNHVPDEVTGEIFIEGAGVADGYYQNQDETQERFVQSEKFEGQILYRSGDIAYSRTDGELVYLGRCRDEIKIRGYRVSLSEIENKIWLSGLVENANVRIIKNERGCSIICAYLKIGNEEVLEQLRHYMSECLPDYMLPEYYICLEEFPLNKNGKLDDSKFPYPFKEKNVIYGDVNMTGLKELKEGITKILCVQDVTPDLDFYEAGGDSIKAIQLSSFMRRYGYELPVPIILKASQVYQMAGAIKKAKDNIEEQGEKKGTIQNTPIVARFLLQKFSQIGHYNQSILLRMKTELSLDKLNEIFYELMKNHDMLGANYDKDQDMLFYNQEHLKKFELVKIVDLTQTGKTIEEAVKEELYHNFRLDTELLFRIVWFIGRKQEYLLMQAHHLVVDGMSWRIILEDFYIMLEQQKKQKHLKLPPKTSSYQEYASCLSYKKEEFEQFDNFGMEKKTFYRDLDILKFELEQENTSFLTNVIYKLTHLGVRDILLVALFNTMDELYGEVEHTVELEGHGREDMNGLDLARTVGWFTRFETLTVSTDKEEKNAFTKLIKLGQQIQAGRNNCKGKFLRFNYLGEYTEPEKDYFEVEEFLFKDDIGMDNEVSFQMELNAMQIHGKLTFFVRYVKKQNGEGKVFLACYQKKLYELIATCKEHAEKYGSYEVSCVDISQSELDGLFE